MSDMLLNALSAARYRQQEQRLGQIIVNALQSHDPSLANADVHRALFYINNEELAKILMDYIYKPRPEEASYVKTDQGRWLLDLTPIKGPRIAFMSEARARAAEIVWLRDNPQPAT